MMMSSFFLQNNCINTYLKERKWVLWYGLLLIFFTTIPYMIGYWSAGLDYRFTGFLFGVEDGNSYIAKMLRGANGEWLFRSPYSAVNQAGFVAFFPYLLLGKFTAPPGQHEQLVVIYHTYRMFGIMLSCLAIYDLTKLFFKENLIRRLCIILSTLGGGLGSLFLIFPNIWMGPLPLEFYSPEAFGFLALLFLPHITLGRAMMLWGLILLVKEDRFYGNNLDFSAMAGGILWLLLGFFQPLTVVLVWVISWIFILLHFWKNKLSIRNIKPTLIRFGIMVLISSPLVIHTIITSLNDKYFISWSTQNQIFSPPPQDFLLAYGLVLPLAVFGAIKALKNKDRQWLLPIGWIIIIPLLVYAPINLQRRLSEGFWVGLILLFLYGYQQLRNNSIRTSILRFVFVISMIPSTIFMFGTYEKALRPGYPVFIPVYEIEFFIDMAADISKDDVVLANYQISNPLPAWVPVRTITGHQPESAEFVETQKFVDLFFNGKMDIEEGKIILNRYEIKYILTGPTDMLPNWLLGEGTEIIRVSQDGKFALLRIPENR